MADDLGSTLASTFLSEPPLMAAYAPRPVRPYTPRAMYSLRLWGGSVCQCGLCGHPSDPKSDPPTRRAVAHGERGEASDGTGAGGGSKVDVHLLAEDGAAGSTER